jgi:hypothetical protein
MITFRIFNLLSIPDLKAESCERKYDAVQLVYLTLQTFQPRLEPEPMNEDKIVPNET